MDTDQELENLLTGAILRAIRRQNSLAVATSGGLDSSILAALLAKHADIPIQLVTVGAPGSTDPQRARVLANHLKLPLAEVVLTKPTAANLLDELLPLLEPEPIDPHLAQEWNLPPDTQRVNPIRAAVGLVMLAAAQEAARFSKRLVLGQGADEYFAGYARYSGLDETPLRAALERDRNELTTRSLPTEDRISKHAKIQFHYPYLNERVAAFGADLPQESLVLGDDRKVALRSFARSLGLPAAITDIPKTAAQYGSGAGELLKELAQAAGLPQNDFLTQRAQRRIGELHSLRT